MRNSILIVLTSAALSVSAPSFAQATPADVGVAWANVSATDYVKLAADADNFEVQSGRIAAAKSKRADVKGFAKQMVADHTATTKSLLAGLKNNDRTITAPSTVLSADNQAKIVLLKKTPKASFDQIYLQQQVAAHQAAWALQKGYADTGTDATLKQIAAAAVPVIEHHLSMVKAMTGGM